MCSLTMHGCQGERRRLRITGLRPRNFPCQSSYAPFLLEWPIVKIDEKLKTERFQVGQLCGSQNKRVWKRGLSHWKCVSWRQHHDEMLQQEEPLQEGNMAWGLSCAFQPHT